MRALRKIFGPKRDEVTSEWRKLHYDLSDLYSSPNQLEKNEMGGACSTYGREAHTGFWWGNLRERDHLKDLGVDGVIILRWIFRKWYGGDMDWIDLAEDKDRWRELVNAVMNLRVP